MYPDEIQSYAVRLKNVISQDLSWRVESCECMVDAPTETAFPCPASVGIAVYMCSGSIFRGGLQDLGPFAEVTAPNLVGVHALEWTIVPEDPLQERLFFPHQRLVMTVSVTVVADASMFDARRTILRFPSVQPQNQAAADANGNRPYKVTADADGNQPFRLMVSVYDTYGNEILVAGVEKQEFSINITRFDHPCIVVNMFYCGPDKGCSPDSNCSGANELYSETFKLEYDHMDESIHYTVYPVVVRGIGRHAAHTMTRITSDPLDSELVRLDDVFSFSPRPIGCPTELGRFNTIRVPDQVGSRCINIRCERGEQPSNDQLACNTCTPGTFSVNGSSCEPCALGRFCHTSGCVECPHCDAGKISNRMDNISNIPANSACDDCLAGQYSGRYLDGPGLVTSLVCASCQPGQYDDDRDAATPCIKCSADTYSSEPQSISCLQCPLGQVSAAGSARCMCDQGRYDAAYGLILCYEGDFAPDQLDTVDYENTRGELNSHTQCLSCPPCVECPGNGSAPVVASKYSLSPAGLSLWQGGLETFDDSHPYPHQRRQLLSEWNPNWKWEPSQSINRDIFRCPVDGETCQPTNQTTADYSSTKLCTTGHTGVLCGSCETDWTGGNMKLCEPCPEGGGGGAVQGLLGLLIALIIAVGVLKVIAKKTEDMEKSLLQVRKRYAMLHQAAQEAQRVNQDVNADDSDHDDPSAGSFQSVQEMLKIIISNIQVRTYNSGPTSPSS